MGQGRRRPEVDVRDVRKKAVWLQCGVLGTTDKRARCRAGTVLTVLVHLLEIP